MVGSRRALCLEPTIPSPPPQNAILNPP
jgi:hypothetical protein